MDKCAIIRLLESGYSRRYVSKELKINRRTVTKYWEEYLKTKEQIALDPTDPCKKDSLTAIPTYNSSNRTPRKYTEEIDKRIDELLDFDNQKSKKLGSHKQKLTTRSIYEILDSEGFDIAESTIRPYVRRKIQKQREAFIKQIYPLGYRAEFDFGEVKCLINGKKRTLYLAVFSSPSTGYRWCKLYNSSNQQVFIDAHIQFFKEVQGVYSTVVYDNMRNVIQKFVGKHDKKLNQELLKISLFYGFEPVVTNTYSGNEKGHVEKSVQVIRDRAFTKIYEFSSIEHAQSYLTSALSKMNQEKEIASEKDYLKPLVSDYDYAITTSQRVDKYSFIHVQNNFYSVPDYLVGETVTVKLYLKKLKVVRNGQIVASHVRLDSRNEYQVQMFHYLYTLKRKPGAIEHSLLLTKLPRLRRCFLQFYKKQPKRFIQLVENKKSLSIDELVSYLDDKAVKDREVLEHNISNKVINEARNQLKAYNEMHKVTEAVKS